MEDEPCSERGKAWHTAGAGLRLASSAEERDRCMDMYTVLDKEGHLLLLISLMANVNTVGLLVRLEAVLSLMLTD